MTKLVVAGVEYDLNAAMLEVSTGTIKAMALQSALVGEPVTMDYLEQQQERIDKMREDPSVSPLALGTDVGSLDVLTAYIFMAKRHAGEQVTWAQAEAFSPTVVELVEDDEPAAVEVPKDLPADVDPEPVLPVSTI